jgi:hypothetical protein
LDILYSVTSALFALAELTDPLWESESPRQRFGALALLLAHQLDAIYGPISQALEPQASHKAHDAEKAPPL